MLVGPLMLLVIVPALRMVFLGKDADSDNAPTVVEPTVPH